MPKMTSLEERFNEKFPERYNGSHYRLEPGGRNRETILDFFKDELTAIASEAREELAELEHDQWIAWSKNIAEFENLSPERLERWGKLWKSYSKLTEAEKNQDRKWADKALEIIRGRMGKCSHIFNGGNSCLKCSFVKSIKKECKSYVKNGQVIDCICGKCF